MPLDYTDFAHYYEDSGSTDAERQASFEAFSNLMECIVRLFWDEQNSANMLGISFNGDILALPGTVDSDYPITILFNGAASLGAAGKKEP